MPEHLLESAADSRAQTRALNLAERVKTVVLQRAAREGSFRVGGRRYSVTAIPRKVRAMKESASPLQPALAPKARRRTAHDDVLGEVGVGTHWRDLPDRERAAVELREHGIGARRHPLVASRADLRAIEDSSLRLAHEHNSGGFEQAQAAELMAEILG